MEPITVLRQVPYACVRARLCNALKQTPMLNPGLCSMSNMVVLDGTE